MGGFFSRVKRFFTKTEDQAVLEGVQLVIDEAVGSAQNNHIQPVSSPIAVLNPGKDWEKDAMEILRAANGCINATSVTQLFSSAAEKALRARQSDVEDSSLSESRLLLVEHYSVIPKFLHDYICDHPLFAIAGSVNVGKSSFINWLTQSKKAKTGMNETTMEPEMFEFEGTMLCDLPGAGTVRNPQTAEEYVKKFGLRFFACVFILVKDSESAFAASIAKILSECRPPVPFYLCRNHADTSLSNAVENDGVALKVCVDEMRKSLECNYPEAYADERVFFTSFKPIDTFNKKLSSNDDDVKSIHICVKDEMMKLAQLFCMDLSNSYQNGNAGFFSYIPAIPGLSYARNSSSSNNNNNNNNNSNNNNNK